MSYKEMLKVQEQMMIHQLQTNPRKINKITQLKQKQNNTMINKTVAMKDHKIMRNFKITRNLKINKLMIAKKLNKMMKK